MADMKAHPKIEIGMGGPINQNEPTRMIELLIDERDKGGSITRMWMKSSLAMFSTYIKLRFGEQ